MEPSSPLIFCLLEMMLIKLVNLMALLKQIAPYVLVPQKRLWKSPFLIYPKRPLPDTFPGSQDSDTIIFSDDAITLCDVDSHNIGSTSRTFEVLLLIRGTKNVVSPNFLTQPTNSQAIVDSSPRQSNTPLTSRSPSTPNTNPSRNLNIALTVNELSTIDFSPRPIQILFSPTSLEHTSLHWTLCVERYIQTFS